MITTKKLTKKQELEELKKEIQFIVPHTTIAENIIDMDNNNMKGNPKYASLDEIKKALLEDEYDFQ
jgi:hypothetical protein